MGQYYWTNAIVKMNLSAPTTITLRRPSADADLIISRHDDTVTSGSNRTTCDVTDRIVSYSDPSTSRSSTSVKVMDHCQGQRETSQLQWSTRDLHRTDCTADVTVKVTDSRQGHRLPPRSWPSIKVMNYCQGHWPPSRSSITVKVTDHCQGHL